LGVFVLVRGHTFWQTILGIYLICLGLNYLPLPLHAIGLRDTQIARQMIESELGDTPAPVSRYRAQSRLLLVPLFVAIVGVSQWRRIHS
jgi:hypothetical protein